jgi:hypothetical protein
MTYIRITNFNSPPTKCSRDCYKCCEVPRYPIVGPPKETIELVTGYYYWRKGGMLLVYIIDDDIVWIG